MNTHSIPKRIGFLESTLQKVFTRSAKVLHIEEIGTNFRLITLGGNELRNVSWNPGDKIQLQLGGWIQRTYTPMDWDSVSGRVRILVYLHGDAPGTRWASSLHKGDICQFLGPRKSVRLKHPSSVILFGDETSIGLAAALSHLAPVRLLCEEPVRATAERVVSHLRNEQVEVVQNDDIAALAQTDPTAEIVLTGWASAIQQMNRNLRANGVAAGRRQAKAYWSTGKTGLD